MDLEGIMLSEIRQIEKDKCHMIWLVCGIKTKTKKMKTKPSLQIQRADWWLPKMRGLGVGKMGEGDQKFLKRERRKCAFTLFLFYFILKLYIIVLVLPNIKMNPSQVYMCHMSSGGIHVGHSWGPWIPQMFSLLDLYLRISKELAANHDVKWAWLSCSYSFVFALRKKKKKPLIPASKA